MWLLISVKITLSLFYTYEQKIIRVIKKLNTNEFLLDFAKHFPYCHTEI